MWSDHFNLGFTWESFGNILSFFLPVCRRSIRWIYPLAGQGSKCAYCANPEAPMPDSWNLQLFLLNKDSRKWRTVIRYDLWCLIHEISPIFPIQQHSWTISLPKLYPREIGRLDSFPTNQTFGQTWSVMMYRNFERCVDFFSCKQFISPTSAWDGKRSHIFSITSTPRFFFAPQNTGPPVKSLQFLLSRTQAGPDRAFKQ